MESPISFIKVPMEIEAKFLNGDGDKFKYYRGTITHVHEVGNINGNAYMDCHVIYDDGDEVFHSIFHDDDFESDTDDSWRFVDSNSKIIKALRDNTLELDKIKKKLNNHALNNYNNYTGIGNYIGDLDEDEDEDEDEEEDEEEEDEEDDEDEDEDAPRPIIEKKRSKFAWLSLFVGGICIGVAVSDLVKRRLNLNMF